MRPRYATENDFPEVEALLRACALPIEGVRAHIERYIVARDNAGLLGCAGIEQYGAVGLLRGLAVAQRARSAGLGELLISTIVADVRQRGVESIVLQTTSASAYFARLPAPAGRLFPRTTMSFPLLIRRQQRLIAGPNVEDERSFPSQLVCRRGLLRPRFPSETQDAPSHPRQAPHREHRVHAKRPNSAGLTL
jgi:amino-acid N-acetyltransferase